MNEYRESRSKSNSSGALWIYLGLKSFFCNRVPTRFTTKLMANIWKMIKIYLNWRKSNKKSLISETSYCS